MRCPYCYEHFNASTAITYLFTGLSSRTIDQRQFAVVTAICSNSNCGKPIIHLRTTYFPDSSGMPAGFASPPSSIDRLIVPKTLARPNVVLSDIPTKYLEDYQEACDVITDSPKASAALSRRLLQSLLRDELHAHHSDLSTEIGEIIGSKQLHSRHAGKLDAVRVIGNFAAHPIKSTNGGEIVDVEPGEAELNLDVIESLFDYLFTAPRIDGERLSAINTKLSDAGKPTIEQTIARRAAKLEKTDNRDRSNESKK